MIPTNNKASLEPSYIVKMMMKFEICNNNFIAKQYFCGTIELLIFENWQ